MTELVWTARSVRFLGRRFRCRGTRLANDLRSAVREHLEGSVNALVVLQGQALKEAQAVAFVRAELAHDLSALEALPPGPAASPMASFATRAALLTIHLYAQRDFAEGPPSRDSRCAQATAASSNT